MKYVKIYNDMIIQTLVGLAALPNANTPTSATDAFMINEVPVREVTEG